jgi:hypothetical protein
MNWILFKIQINTPKIIQNKIINLIIWIELNSRNSKQSIKKSMANYNSIYLNDL